MLFGKYRFICVFEKEVLLPDYKGSTFRGVFAHALKKVICALKFFPLVHIGKQNIF